MKFEEVQLKTHKHHHDVQAKLKGFGTLSRLSNGHGKLGVNLAQRNVRLTLALFLSENLVKLK